MTFKKQFIMAGTGDSYDIIGGDHVTIKATGEDTGGVLTVLEQALRQLHTYC